MCLVMCLIVILVSVLGFSLVQRVKLSLFLFLYFHANNVLAVTQARHLYLHFCFKTVHEAISPRGSHSSWTGAYLIVCRGEKKLDHFALRLTVNHVPWENRKYDSI